MAEIENSYETKSPRELALDKIDEMLWTNEEAILIGTFLRGEEIDSLDRFDPKRSIHWNDIAAINTFKPNELRHLYNFVEDYISSLPEPIEDFDEKTPEGNDEVIDEPQEYEYIVTTRAKTVMNLAHDLLRKTGIMDATDSRLVGSLVCYKDRTNFAQYNLVGSEIPDSFIHRLSGGPSTVSQIQVPQFESIKGSKDDQRQRRSLSHEIAHDLRALTNIPFWRNFESAAARHKLKHNRTPTPSFPIKKTDLPQEKINIGGYYVGANAQGSEAIGELFSIAIKRRKEDRLTLNDIQDSVNIKLINSKNKFEPKLATYESETSASNKTNYFPARLALSHHVNQLISLGFGDIEVLDLLALGTYGYVSLEKVPALIQLGILTQEKYKKMKVVIQTIHDWITSQKEDGYTPQI